MEVERGYEIRGKVVLEGSAQDVVLRATLTDLDVHPVYRKFFLKRVPQVTCRPDTSGAFTLRPLTPGSYALEAQVGEELRAIREISVSTPTDVGEIVLDPRR